jgi:hypothetical protein
VIQDEKVVVINAKQSTGHKLPTTKRECGVLKIKNIGDAAAGFTAQSGETIDNGKLARYVVNVGKSVTFHAVGNSWIAFN